MQMKNELLFSSELLLFDFQELNKNNNPFTSIFCVFNKTYFKYYSSREAYYQLTNPLFCLTVSNIITCNKLTVDIKSKENISCNMNFFYIKYLFNEEVKQYNLGKYASANNNNNKRNTASNFKEFSSNFLMHSKERIRSVNSETKKINNKRKESNNKSPHQHNNKEYKDLKSSKDTVFQTNNTIIFGSKVNELINKWICSINFLIKN